MNRSSAYGRTPSHSESVGECGRRKAWNWLKSSLRADGVSFDARSRCEHDVARATAHRNLKCSVVKSLKSSTLPAVGSSLEHVKVPVK